MILLVLLSITLFFLYKIVMLKKYKTDSVAIDNALIFNKSLNIKYSHHDNTVIFKEMSYRDYFTDYIKNDNNDFKVKHNANGNVTSFYNIIREKQYIKVLNMNSFKLMTYDKENRNINYSTENDLKKIST